MIKKLLLILFLVPAAVHASPDSDSIRQACLKQAIATAQQLKGEIFTSMDRNQADHIVQISSNQCQQQFMSMSVSTSVENSTKEDEESGGDWFTDYILNGEAPDKDGNRRLEKMRHK